MAAAGCVFHRTLTRVRTGTNDNNNNKASLSSPVVCRESLYVVDVLRYTRDQGSSVYFPQSVLSGDDLYDVILTDGDCRLQVTLDPGLNRLVEQNVLQPRSVLRDTTFVSAMAAQHPAYTGASGETESYRLTSVEVRGRGDEGGVRRSDVDSDSLPWFGSSAPAGPLVPLRATRGVFLPLWNNVDYSGEVWREAPSADEEEEDEEEAQRPGVTVSELRDAFLSGHWRVVRGTIQQQLIVRIVNKSCLVYYGKPDQWGVCPYKAVFEVCDHTGSVCAVLWTSVSLRWYRYLKPGDVISLRRYRVKRHYHTELDDIEISINSRNPAAHIRVLPESSVSPEYLPPAPNYNFLNSEDLVDPPQGTAVCDVIGLLTFCGRPERVRVKGGRGEELIEYRWLRLEDGASDRPIMVKLFCTSQPQTHSSLHPLSVVVCTRLKLVKSADETRCFFLTNTTYTQVYCTGRGDHSRMSYRKLGPVRLFLQWLRTQDDVRVLSTAMIGGSFVFPPRPVALETYMKERRGEPRFLRGAELQRELKDLMYRERGTFCIQATVTMVAYSCRGQEDHCLFWTDQASSRSPSSSSSSSPRVSHPSPSLSISSLSLPPLPSSPHSFRPPLSSTCASPLSPTSSYSVCPLTPPPLDCRAGRRKRKQLLQSETPKKRHPLVTLQEEQNNQTAEILFEASMEFLRNTADDNSDDDDDDGMSFITAPLPPTFTPIATETLPMRYDHTHREEQAAAVAMGGWVEPGRFDSAFEDYYILRLRALSDSVMVDVVFLPHSSSSSSASLPHSNTWTSILSHGAFSSHQPPPSPADLINMAAQLTNQRLVCVLEACQLGGGNVELILGRAFQLPH